MATLDAVVAKLKTLSDAHLPHTVSLRHGARTALGGGKWGVTWDAGVVWTEPARISPASAPQERLSAGSITEIRDVFVVTRDGVSVPQDSGDDVYRLEFAHDFAGVANPLPLYLRGTPLHSYRAMGKFLCSTVGGP